MLALIKTCTECGGTMRGSAGLGLCSACLLQGAMRIEAWPEEAEEAGGLGGSAARKSGPGDYEIQQEIARGGMGVVYRARQRSLNRIVALKVLLGGTLAGEEGRRRMQMEAAAAARLRHPNIVPVYEAGEFDGQPFYAMAFIEGRTLADIIRDGPMPAARAARYLARITEAVHHAHREGVLHRDLKPSNVLIDADDEPHVTDFGLAKILDGIGGETLTGSVLGSPAYMPPEQALGRTAEIGPVSDVYSLGAVLYELLTGLPPFQGDSPSSIIEQVKTAEPVPPRRLNASIPIDLETVCLKCLEKEGARRYASAEELALDLRRFLGGEPVRARPVGPFGKGVRWMRRHPLAAALAALSFVMLMTVVAVSVTSAARIKVSRDAARARLVESLVSEARALRVAGEPGHRAASLERLQEAHLMDESGRLEARLRQEVIATLSRPDLRRHLITNLPATADLMMVCLDPSFERAALWNETNHEAQIFQLSDGRCLTRWEAKRPDEIEAFSADGKFISVRYGGVHDVWDVANATRVLATNGAQSLRKFSTGAFSPDGRRFARGEQGRQLGLYELIPSQPARRLAGWPLPEGMALKSLAWSPEGDALALILNDQTVAVCDATNGTVRWQRDFARSLWNIKWNNRVGLIVVQGALDKVLLLAAGDGRDAETFNQATDQSSLALISEDGRRLVTSGADGGTRFLDLLTGQSRMADRASAWHLHFDPTGLKIGTLLDAGRPLWLEWLPPVVQRTWRASSPAANSQALSYSRDGHWLVSLTADGPAIWDTSTGRQAAILPKPEINAAFFSGEGQLLCHIGSKLEELEFNEGWNAPPTARRILIEGNRLAGAAESSRGHVAAADFGLSAVHFLDRKTGARRRLGPLPNPILTAFSPDGRWLASASDFVEEVFLWDMDDPDRAPVRLKQAGIKPLFTADGQWLLTVGSRALLWRVGTWQPGPLLPLAANNAGSFTTALSRDGRWLAATQREREVHLVELATRRTVAVLDGPGEGNILKMTFSPEGATLAIARQRGDIQLWHLPTLRAELSRLGLDWE